jgi:hypothetical protein
MDMCPHRNNSLSRYAPVDYLFYDDQFTNFNVWQKISFKRGFVAH